VKRLASVWRRLRVMGTAWKVLGEHPEWTNEQVDEEIARRTGRRVR